MVFRQVSISKLILLSDRSCHSIRRHYLYPLAYDSRPSLLLQDLDQLTGAEPWRHGHAHAHSPPWRIDRRHLVLSTGRASSHITCYECLESRASGLGEARVRRRVQDVDRLLRRRSGHPAHGDRWVKWRSETERECVGVEELRGWVHERYRKHDEFSSLPRAHCWAVLLHKVLLRKQSYRLLTRHNNGHRRNPS